MTGNGTRFAAFEEQVARVDRNVARLLVATCEIADVLRELVEELTPFNDSSVQAELEAVRAEIAPLLRPWRSNEEEEALLA